MPNNIIPSIETLPVELLHRIFDNLDAQTILLSVRSVSRSFRSVANTYNRYVLNFKLISKSNFHLLCRFINPQNVISLLFSNDEHTTEQIKLLFSSVRLQQFTRLHSLTLHNINEDQLKFILENINLNLLTSFSLSIAQYDNAFIETTTNLLSSIIAKVTLRKLDLNLDTTRMTKIAWPMNCTIQYLTINNYVYSTYIDDLYRIFQCSSHLHTLIMSKTPTISIKNLTLIRFRQLTSLTITDNRESVHDVESFLLLTPSLVHLKLVGGKTMLDGKRWEQFIEINLQQLNKFEFYFIESRLTDQTPTDVELIIASFQTLFWIQRKKWFVTCECLTQYPKTIYLSSIPYCTSSVNYTPKSEKISLSTYPITTDDDLPMIDRITVLWLNLNQATADDLEKKKATTNHPLFLKVNEIHLRFFKDWPLLSLQSLSVFIDISRIVKMKVYTNCFNEYNESTWMDISFFMKQAHNLSSLIISDEFHKYSSDRTAGNIYSILPHHIKHLQIPMDDLDQLKVVVERCENLSTISIISNNEKLCKQLIKWLAESTINTTCKESYETVAVWLGKIKLRSTEANVNHKRIKLTDND